MGTISCICELCLPLQHCFFCAFVCWKREAGVCTCRVKLDLTLDTELFYRAGECIDSEIVEQIKLDLFFNCLYLSSGVYPLWMTMSSS